MDILILNEFAHALKVKFSALGNAAPEDQLKFPVSELLMKAGIAFGLNVQSRTESTVPELNARPDIAVHVARLICGYVELKAPGLGADAPRLRGAHNKDQWKKLKSLPNLIYTDGCEWALYRNGKRQGPIVRFDGDPTKEGKKAISEDNADRLGRILRDFLSWEPIVPHQPKRLANYLAPLARFLRSEIEAALPNRRSAAALLRNEWQNYFFPEATNEQFSDAYSQTITYALLLARISGAEDLTPSRAAPYLGNKNGVLSVALDRLGQEQARKELRVGFELLKRSLEALDPVEFLKPNPEMWLYFYEDFLAAYDPKLRKDYGVYYTPPAVVELQVRLVSELLAVEFDKRLSFADDGVVFLDPAIGTGTYAVSAVNHALAIVRSRYGEGNVGARAVSMAANMHGFEVLIGPYAVAHLRLTQALESQGASINDRLNIYLSDTLESPHSTPPGELSLTYKEVTEEHEAARKVKTQGEILVCLGNPPYDRQTIEQDDTETVRKGGWVRFGDRPDEPGILDDFLAPVRDAGEGIHLKNLYNDYVYFWRWALWRLFEKQEQGGIVSFITASSYLSGPGFIGMREVIRRTFDKFWIIDLGGDNLGTRKTPNVFNIQTPVAIAIGLRTKDRSPENPAVVRYARIDAPSREEKLDQLAKIANRSDLHWRACPTDWHAPFVPETNETFFDWPALTDLFPWQHSGAQFKRKWPIGATKEQLERRVSRLLRAATLQDRKKLFKETRDRKIARVYKDFSGQPLESISEANAELLAAEPERYCYRQFDRQYALIDNRLGDYLRPSLLSAAGQNNIFLFSLTKVALGEGAAIGVSAEVPDLHVFRGSFGGKHIMPLYRDAQGDQPNITKGLLEVLGRQYGRATAPEDLAAYAYAVLGGQSYTRLFWQALEKPDPRVPVTKDGSLFFGAAELGRRLIWLHTYSQRFQGNGRGSRVPQGTTRCVIGVSDDPAAYPEEYGWLEKEQSIWIGEGRFAPVPSEIWNFEVSGLRVVDSWLGYRKKIPSGRKSSDLDKMGPKRWTARMSEELLELLWVLEATLAMEPALERILDDVVDSACFKSSELPQPLQEQRKAPSPSRDQGKLRDQGQLLNNVT